MFLVIAGIIGLLAGVHAATWGMYKDAIHEGFTYRKYNRSVVLGIGLGVLLQALEPLDLSRASSMVVMFGLVYIAERAVVELWKTFLREEDQSKYFIPMQFSLFGRPVQSRAVRWLVLLGCIVAIGGGVWLLRALQRATTGVAPWLMVLALGGLAGMFTAVGGAWKDAPKEGFDPLKFFRSPLMTLAWALVLALLTDNYAHIVLAALGYERATIETYKTFFFPSRPRGKFAGKPVLYPEMLVRRQRFVPVYFGIWLVVLGASCVAFAQARHGAL